LKTLRLTITTGKKVRKWGASWDNQSYLKQRGGERGGEGKKEERGGQANRDRVQRGEDTKWVKAQAIPRLEGLRKKVNPLGKRHGAGGKNTGGGGKGPSSGGKKKAKTGKFSIALAVRKKENHGR